MRTLNPYTRSNLRFAGLKGYNRKTRGNPRKDSTNIYVLTVGGEPTDEELEMVCADAIEENKDLQIAFCLAVGKGRPNGERLHRWEVKQNDKEQEP
tara:strand:+ start:2284 stop:2571 length:288 start_codon:yes stop_codon:yes gene_type:complete